MRLAWEPVTLELKLPFHIAHQRSDTRRNVIARLGLSRAEAAGLDEPSGLGEAAGVTYLGETEERIIEYLQGVDLSGLEDPTQIDDVLEQLPPGSAAARAACDMALHDLWGQRLGQPLYRLLGLNPARIPLSSFTLAIAEPELMAKRAQEAGLPILKIKLGDDQDEARIRAIREACPATLRVDANASWTLEKAQRLLPRLWELGVELVEQPLPIGDLSGLRALAQVTPRPPLFADESIKTCADIVAHAGCVDGVVIKLAKCGGLREACRQINVAHALDLSVMLSCMVETSLAVTAAAHLGPLVEHIDLDGPWLIANDPYLGLQYQGARILLPDTPGLGVKPRPRF
jgi:L-alanine-DL-glutamate epimerase-like enolase superfamily enzyme